MDENYIQAHIPDKPANIGLKRLALIPIFYSSGKWFM